MNSLNNKKASRTTFIWFILITLVSFNVNAIVPQAERDALVALYNSTDGTNWNDNTNWLVGDPCNNFWVGVACGIDTIISINLSNRGLVGTIPPEIQNLTNINTIRLEFNQLSGGIPIEIGSLSILETLHLYGNQLSGSIPSEIGNLSNLKDLRLQANNLSGNIPPELGALNSLLKLWGWSNQLTGTIPVELGNLSNIQSIALRDNQLSGNLPIELGNLGTLQQFIISKNKIIGEIPSSFINLTNLTSLDLNFNGFYTNDSTLDAFLDTIQSGGNWSSSQTIAPNNITMVNSTQDSITMSWNTIEYIGGGAGRYRVLLSETISGPFIDVAVTGNKVENSITINNLTHSSNYYIVVRTETDGSANPNLNPNTVISEDSLPILATTSLPASVTTQERNALIALYNSTNGANWTNSSNWLVGDPCIDAWFGVTCSGSAVSIVNLRANNLVGTIPTDLGNLTNLIQLYLDNNQLTGTIPIELGNLTNLQNLGLWSNQLTGTIPTQLSNLSNLQQLALSSNQLTGDVPSWLGSLSQLSSLSLYANQLSGVIPTSLGNLSNLRFLRLNDNQLNGTIPASLGNLSNITLFELNLGNNQLTGSIPSSLGNLSSLLYLQLNDNQLNGSIPSSLGNLTDLLELNLSRNNLTGAVPFQLGNLSNLQKLDLSYNFFLGSGTLTMNWIGNLTNLIYLDLDLCLFIFEFNFDIPIEIGNLTSLEHLGLWSFYFQPTPVPTWIENLNNLSYLSLNIRNLKGDIPVWLGDITGLQHLRIRSSSGQLTGVIPTELSNLTNLNYLYLSGGLSGEIPLWISNLNNLNVLVLSNNKHTGTIPLELGNLAQLTWLSLERNKLIGAIPSELQNLSSLESLYLNGNQLSGALPSWIGDFANLQYLYLASNQFKGEFPLNYTNLTNLIETDTRFNALYSNNPLVNDFINAHPCRPTTPDCADNWQSTQTTAPQNLQIVAASDNSISLNWDQVTYPQHGGYKIYMSTDVNGVFTQINETVSKQVTAYTQGMLDAGVNYYFNLKTFTNPHNANQNMVTSNSNTNVFDTTLLTSDSVDLWSIIGKSSSQQVSIGNPIQYTITIGNDGVDDAIGAGFRHNLPTGLINGTWTCTNLTGTSLCPINNGMGDVDLILDLSANSSLEFTITASVNSINASSLLITSTVTPPDGISDTDLLSNIHFLNFERIFANSFE